MLDQPQRDRQRARPGSAARTVFENVADRRFAAAALFNHVVALRREGNLSNVGALATAVVSVGAIERTPGLVRYPERLAAARARAARAGASALTTLPVLRPDDVAALKPAFIVRTPEMFRARTLEFAALYLASFYLVILLWKVLARPWRRAVAGRGAPAHGRRLCRRARASGSAP